MKKILLLSLLTSIYAFSMTTQELSGRLGEGFAKELGKKIFESTGWKLITSKIHGNQGIDYLYVKRSSNNTIKEILVVEVKYGNGQLNMTTNGQQMSKKWIDSRIKLIGNDKLTKAYIKNVPLRKRLLRLKPAMDGYYLSLNEIQDMGLKKVKIGRINYLLKGNTPPEFVKGNYLYIPEKPPINAPKEIKYFYTKLIKATKETWIEYLKSAPKNIDKTTLSKIKYLAEYEKNELLLKKSKELYKNLSAKEQEIFNKLNKKNIKELISKKTRTELKLETENLKIGLVSMGILSLLEAHKDWLRAIKGEASANEAITQSLKNFALNSAVYVGVEGFRHAVIIGTKKGVLIYLTNSTSGVGIVYFLVGEGITAYYWFTHKISTTEFLKATAKNAAGAITFLALGTVIALALPEAPVIIPAIIVTVAGYILIETVLNPLIDKIFHWVSGKNYVSLFKLLDLPDYVKNRLTPWDPPNRITPWNLPDRITPWNPPDRKTPWNPPDRKTPWDY